MRFENLPPFANHLEPPARNFAVAIVSPEVAERLFTFKNHCRSNLSALTAISRHISPIPAFWQANFHRGRAIRCRDTATRVLPSRCPLLRRHPGPPRAGLHLRWQNPFGTNGDRQIAAGFRLLRGMDRKMTTQIWPHN